MNAEPPKIGYREVLVACGLGKPSSRSFVAGVAVAGVLYAAGLPKAAFLEDGGLAPFKPIQPGPYSVGYQHFLVAPLTVAAAVWLLT
jgi:hypothetical protein